MYASLRERRRIRSGEDSSILDNLIPMLGVLRLRTRGRSGPSAVSSIRGRWNHLAPRRTGAVGLRHLGRIRGRCLGSVGYR